jgi:type II secretory pathway component GspD/PulD (secretin)
MDTPEKIKEAEEVLQAMESKNSIKVFTLQYARATEVAEQLKSQLDLKKVGSIKADERANQVIVQTLPERMKDIENLIAGLDRKTKEVLIDVKIIKVRLSDQRDTGIEWEGLFRLGRDFGMAYLGSYPFSAVQSASAAWKSREQFLSDPMSGSVGAYPFSGTTSDYDLSTKVTPGEEMHVGVVSGRHDFDVLIKYLQTIGKTKILSNPTLAAINNHEATIHIGERRAYVTTTTTASSTTTTTAEEVTYVDTGIKLSMTPTINDEGYVLLKIRPEISSVIGTIQTSSNNEIPIIDTSTAETVVMAKDGATIVLGGLGKEEKTETTEQVPFLGRIPLLGALFRSSTKLSVRTELIIMITPTIFEGDVLVATQDKSMDRYVIKSTKKFDVFREEMPEAETRKVSAGIEDEKKLIPKGFKQYN